MINSVVQRLPGRDRRAAMRRLTVTKSRGGFRHTFFPDNTSYGDPDDSWDGT